MHISLSSFWALSAYSAATSVAIALKSSVFLLRPWRSDTTSGRCSHIAVTLLICRDALYTHIQRSKKKWQDDNRLVL